VVYALIGPFGCDGTDALPVTRSACATVAAALLKGMVLEETVIGGMKPRGHFTSSSVSGVAVPSTGWVPSRKGPCTATGRATVLTCVTCALIPGEVGNFSCGRTA